MHAVTSPRAAPGDSGPEAKPGAGGREACDGWLRVAAAEEASRRPFLVRRLAARDAGPAVAIAALALTCALAGAGCARTAAKPVPIDARPTPAQPGPADSTLGFPPAGSTPGEAPHETPDAARSRAAADTLAARSALKRCEGRKLLPEQESTIDAANRLLAETRDMLDAGDFSRAESLARQARQLTKSLGCP